MYYALLYPCNRVLRLAFHFEETRQQLLSRVLTANTNRETTEQCKENIASPPAYIAETRPEEG